MTTNSRRSDELLKKALEDAVNKGILHQVPIEHPILVRGLVAVDEPEEPEKEPELAEWPHWANWRLILSEGDEASAVYFTRKPTYAEKKAFCAIAGISPEKVEAEEKL